MKVDTLSKLVTDRDIGILITPNISSEIMHSAMCVAVSICFHSFAIIEHLNEVFLILARFHSLAADDGRGGTSNIPFIWLEQVPRVYRLNSLIQYVFIPVSICVYLFLKWSESLSDVCDPVNELLIGFGTLEHIVHLQVPRTIAE